MQFENFKVFADLVETKSFSKAAKINNMTQSAASQQARAMERNFKTLLIDRSQKRFQLTREGVRIYEASKEILHLYDKLLSELQEMKKVISGTIRISTIYSIGLHELPPFIKRFLHDYPSVNVRIEYRRSNLVYEDVLHNSVDFGLVAFPVKVRQVEILPFRDDRLVLITYPDHPLAGRSDLTLDDLAGQKFIGFDPDIPTRKAVDQIFRDSKMEIEPVMEFDNIETVKRAVEIDHGVSIVPQATVQQEAKQGTLAVVQFAGKEFTRPLAILHRKGRVLTPAMKKFVETLTMAGGAAGKADAKTDKVDAKTDKADKMDKVDAKTGKADKTDAGQTK
jgi:DNA-binding transcriptional LysR family regulator